MRKIFAGFLIFALIMSFIPAVLASAETPNSKSIFYGRTFPIAEKGSDMRKVQQRLHDLGYDVRVDGVCGEDTKTAVAAFQKKSSMYADGLVGLYTWHALFATDKDRHNIQLLARIIAREAGGSVDREQIAIANVVMNYAGMTHRSIEAELKSGRYNPARNWAHFMKTRPAFRPRLNAMRAYYGVKAFKGAQPYYFHGKGFSPAKNSWWRKLPQLGLIQRTYFYGRR